MTLNREALAKELGKVLDAIDALAEERSAVIADIGSRKKALVRRSKEIRDLLSGRAGVQEELPIKTEGAS